NEGRVQAQDRASRGGTLSADGRFALAWHPDNNQILLYDVASGKVIRPFLQGPGAVHNASFSPDGKRVLASYSKVDSVGLWDVARGKESHRLAGNPGGASRVIFSPDGKRALSAGRDGSVRLWRLPD